jgi:DNA replication protein DnaC
LIRQEVEARITAATVEIFHRGKRVASHRIIDDWGLEPLGPEQRHDMLEIVEDRYGRGAMLITSQIPVDRWHDLIGEPTLADAILDRIVHNAHRIDLAGDSLRRARPAAKD